MEWAQIPEEKKNLLIAEMFYFSYILSFSQYLNELKVYSKIRLPEISKDMGYCRVKFNFSKI